MQHIRNLTFMALGAALVLLGAAFSPVEIGSAAQEVDQPISLLSATATASDPAVGLTAAEAEFVRWVSDPANAAWWIDHVTAPEPVVSSVRSAGYDCPGSDWGWAIGKYFEPGDWSTACRVMKCESHGHGHDPVTIVNFSGSSASGLFQFLDGTWRSARGLVGADQYARAKDAPGEVQVAAAAAWKNATSWSQWACY